MDIQTQLLSLSLALCVHCLCWVYRSLFLLLVRGHPIGQHVFLFSRLLFNALGIVKGLICCCGLDISVVYTALVD